MENKRYNHVLRNSLIIFFICLAVHAIEVIFIRTDETFFAECFINKVFGIIVLLIVLRLLTWHWSDIGFTKNGIIKNILKGFLLCTIFYTLGFIAEFIILGIQHNPGHFEFFVTGFSLTGNVVKQTGFGIVLMCIFPSTMLIIAYVVSSILRLYGSIVKVVALCGVLATYASNSFIFSL